MQTMLQGKSGTFYNPRYYFINNDFIFCKGGVRNRNTPSFNGNALVDILKKDSYKSNLTQGVKNDTLHTTK